MLSQCDDDERAQIKDCLETLSFQNLAEAVFLSLASAYEVGNHKRGIKRVKTALEIPSLILKNYSNLQQI
jgi:hypothetical protein